MFKKLEKILKILSEAKFVYFLYDVGGFVAKVLHDISISLNFIDNQCDSQLYAIYSELIRKILEVWHHDLHSTEG